MVFLTPLLTGRELAGAASFRFCVSPARSAKVARLVEGSGTAKVNGLPGASSSGGGSLQPESLCFAAGCGNVLRAFMPDSFNSPKTRGGELNCLNVVGGLKPVGFILLYSGGPPLDVPSSKSASDIPSSRSQHP